MGYGMLGSGFRKRIEDGRAKIEAQNELVQAGF
jgi:hypothetical protein